MKEIIIMLMVEKSFKKIKLVSTGFFMKMAILQESFMWMKEDI